MNSKSYEYDAVVVGSGPNGLAAAILLQQNGLSVLLLEGKDQIGGGLSTEQLTLPGFYHDVGSAVHPLAAGSPFFQTLPLEQHGLHYIYPDTAAAHPLDSGSAAVLKKSVTQTASLLGEDCTAYTHLIQPLVDTWPGLAADALAALHFPRHPLDMAQFGFKALTSAVALVLMANGHLKGWPVPKGGAKSIASALASFFISIGGKIETGTYIKTLSQLPSAKAILFDVTPKQLLTIAGHQFSTLYKWQLERYRYGMGVFKIDWALDDSIPFKAEAARQAGTIHLGGTLEEITYNEAQTSKGHYPDLPFVLLAQQSVFDSTRAPASKHTGWAYCHVPNGSRKDMTENIERQVERFAPGFRERILARHTFNTSQLESYNPNNIGGDINGGIIDLGQLFTRPALRSSPYRTSAKGLYICSSSTPPGGGVHGMSGYNAASQALKDVFNIHPRIL